MTWFDEQAHKLYERYCGSWWLPSNEPTIAAALKKAYEAGAAHMKAMAHDIVEDRDANFHDEQRFSECLGAIMLIQFADLPFIKEADKQ